MTIKRGASEEESDDENESNDGMDSGLEDGEDGRDNMKAEVITAHSGNLPFLDTFYGLASSSPIERSQSAQAMLNHCLLGPSANAVDAAYAFRRLLNGLCSGRAAARQGYASALTSFLKIGHQTGALKSLQDESKEFTLLGFLRNQLIKATDPSETIGKKKGSEERDHHFGRLFGILSVIRSGILLPVEEVDNFEDAKDVAYLFAKDLVELYKHRKWMREPTAFAIINFLDSYYSLCRQPAAADIVNYIVREVFVPELLAGTKVSEYTAEQIALVCNIQCQSLQGIAFSLPPALSVVVLSKDNIPLLAKALSATSAVSQPRLHVVWDVIWCLYLTIPKDTTAKPLKGKPMTRILRDTLPGCSDRVEEIIAAIVEYVITQSLLGIDPESGGSAGINATHERRALAMALIKLLCGCDGQSQKVGSYSLEISGSLLEKYVLTPQVVQKVFIDVICAGGSKHSSHLLKPLAQNVLESIVARGGRSAEDLARRLSCAKALLSCDPRFDGRTKSGTCANLLLLGDDAIENVTPELIKTWGEYVNFLQAKILAPSNADAHEVVGFVDLLFVAAKRCTRLNATGENENWNTNLFGQILAFFFVGAFFDCSSMKKGGKSTIYSAAKLIHKGTSSVFSYHVRTVMSARYFSLLADSAVVTVPTKTSSIEATAKYNKDFRLYQLLCECHEGWSYLEGKGCRRLGTTTEQNADPDMLADKTILEIVTKQQKAAADQAKNDDGVVQRFRIGCASLSLALHLHLLSCGNPESLAGEDEMDLDEDENNESVIKEFISDLASAQHHLMCQLRLIKKTEEDSTENALCEFAEVCIGVLSSPFGGKGLALGASPKLFKETVRAAWSSAVQLCAREDPQPSPLDKDLVDLLLGSIGAKLEEDHQDEQSENDDHDDNMDSDNEENNDEVFAQAAAAGLDLENEEEKKEEEEDDDDDDVDDQEEDEVKLDSSQLQSVLLESDDDDEEMVLEHHAGADKALAKLIKMKQEARKAGQRALERIELSNQLRCIALLEVVLSNSGRQLDSLFSSEVMQDMILTLLAFRRQLEKSLLGGAKVDKKGSVSENEKRALMEKVTALMKTKLFKMKSLPKMSASEFELLLSGVIAEARKAASDVQLSCCSAAMILLCKGTDLEETLISLSTGYEDLVSEWATKRTTRLKSSILSDIVQQHTSMAQILLSSSLCTASKNARSPFLKSEAFRLLAPLAGRSAKELSEDCSDVDKKGFDAFMQCIDSFVESVVEAIKDSEMRKAKRIRDVLKTTEKFVEVLDKRSAFDAVTLRNLELLIEELTQLQVESESQGVTSLCASLIAKVDSFMKNKKAQKVATLAAVGIDSKKKKKKKGKKR